VDTAHWEVPTPTTPHALATTVLHALARPGGTVPTPAPSENPEKPLLELAGVRSYTTFARGAKAVTVSQEESGIAVVPMHNGDRHTGFTKLYDRARTASPDPDSLGVTLMTALAETT
jgi:hypothetical protein